jgi:hypothetical protein
MRTGRQTLWGEADDAWAAVPSTVPMPATIVRPRPAPGINEVQLDPSTYGTADTISGFRLGTDSLDFAGYASAVSAMAQVTQESDGHGAACWPSVTVRASIWQGSDRSRPGRSYDIRAE